MALSTSTLRPCRVGASGPFRARSNRCISVLSRAGKTDNPFDGPSTPSTSNSAISEEARLELLEASVRGNKRAMQAAKKTIPIKGMVNQKKEDNSNMAPWQEGQLFPDGWDNMPLGEKVTELYMGRRGVLFWLNKAAYASVFILIGGWVIFRFVGPNLGLYTLQGDLVPPPL